MRLKWVALAIALQLIWSLVPSASNLVIQYLPVEFYIMLRWAISGALFLGWARFKHGANFVPSHHLPALVVIGVTGYGLASDVLKNAAE